MNNKNFKAIIKSSIAWALYLSGILLFVKFLKLKNNAIVLMYHRVLPSLESSESFSHDGIVINNRIFAKHIAYLKKHFNLLNVDEFNHCLSNNSFSKYSCLITFDDGWKDNYTYAYRILQEHNAPAVIFLACNYIGKEKLFWQEDICHKINLLIDNKANLAELGDALNAVELDRKNTNNRSQNIKLLVNKLKKITPTERTSTIEKINNLFETNQLSINSNVDNFMDWNNVSKMTDLIKFGSHTMNHTILTEVNDQKIAEELNDSKKTLEGFLGQEIKYIAYPNGNYNPKIIDITKASGYALAFTTNRGYVEPNTNKFCINRINLHSGNSASIPVFLCTILGIF